MWTFLYFPGITQQHFLINWKLILMFINTCYLDFRELFYGSKFYIEDGEMRRSW